MKQMDRTDGRRSARKERLLSTTKGRTLILLCQGRKTVNELVADLGVTDNAVRAQLQRLVRDGLARSAGSRRGVRKPHVEYELTAKARELFPRAYEPVLQELMQVLKDRLGKRALRESLAETGRRLMRNHLGTLRSRGPHQRLVEVMSKLNGSSLGIEVAQEAGKTIIRSCSCPVASLTADHPQLCELFAGTLGEILGANVRERCDRAESPRCCFELSNAQSQA
jgi:predicted ArsR family transcriptional regulator